MKKSELQNLIRECILEVVAENKKQKTNEGLLGYLASELMTAIKDTFTKSKLVIKDQDKLAKMPGFEKFAEDLKKVFATMKKVYSRDQLNLGKPFDFVVAADGDNKVSVQAPNYQIQDGKTNIILLLAKNMDKTFPVYKNAARYINDGGKMSMRNKLQVDLSKIAPVQEADDTKTEVPKSVEDADSEMTKLSKLIKKMPDELKSKLAKKIKTAQSDIDSYKDSLKSDEDGK